MKIKYAIISTTIMVIVLILTIFGQSKYNTKAKTIIKKNDISKMMGKPIFESTIDSLNTKVWIISQAKNKKVMKTTAGKAMGKMKNDNMKMDKATKEAIMTGTHYFVFDVTDIRNNKEIADTSAKVEIVSPSKKIVSVRLQPMMNHFGGGVTLTEKGDYLFTINLNVGSSYKTTQFKYAVR